ncbi:hypothetical protein YC2023_119411 [Brassica napus]
MLLIDEEGTAIQGFVPAGRVGTFDLTDGVVYKLNNFFGSRSKVQYRVADHIATVSFTWNSDLAVLDNPPVPFPEDRFRFHGYEEFRANCDSKGDLYGTLALTTMSSSRVFMDADVQPSKDYLEWYSFESSQPKMDHLISNTIIIQHPSNYRAKPRFECFNWKVGTRRLPSLDCDNLTAMTEPIPSSTLQSRRRRFSEMRFLIRRKLSVPTSNPVQIVR